MDGGAVRKDQAGWEGQGVGPCDVRCAASFMFKAREALVKQPRVLLMSSRHLNQGTELETST